MSIVVKTLTPFTEQDVLVEALISMSVSVTVRNDRIETERRDYQGVQYFIMVNGAYRFAHASDTYAFPGMAGALGRDYVTVKQFLSELEVAYKRAWQTKLERVAEEERKRMERERQDRVEKTRLQAIERAKAQGYHIRETRIKGKIQLVLTRTTY